MKPKCFSYQNGSNQNKRILDALKDGLKNHIIITIY